MENTKQIIDWHGYQIEIACNLKTYNLSHVSGPNMVHIELHTIQPAKAPLPVTGTGYRSHFIHAELLSDYESPAAFVLAWLDHAAQENDWKQIEQDARQFCLF